MTCLIFMSNLLFYSRENCFAIASKKKRKEKLCTIYNITKWNGFSLFLSIVGAHRHYSRMFHWLGCFQARLSTNSNLSIFCVLTRHFFSLVLHFSGFFYALLRRSVERNTIYNFFCCFYFSVGNNRTRSNQDKIPFNNSDKKNHAFNCNWFCMLKHSHC